MLVALGAILGFLSALLAGGPVAAMVVGAALDGDAARSRSIANGGALGQGFWAGVGWVLGGALGQAPGGWERAGQGLGGLILLATGAWLWFRRPGPPRPGGLGLGLLASLLNPAPVVSWMLASGLLRIAEIDGFAVEFGLGVGLGTWAALGVLRHGATRIRHRGGDTSARASRGMALVMFGLGALALYRAAP